MSRAGLPAFTPTAVPGEALVARTVGREEVVDRILTAIRSGSRTKNRPHTLVVGPRGSGKTHLLAVVMHRLAAEPKVLRKLAIAWLPEDAVDVVTYGDLLWAVVQRLFEGAPKGTDAAASLDAARAMRGRNDVNGLERLVVDLLGKRVLLLVVENLDRLFRDLGPEGESRLRSFVETSGNVLLLASTPLLFGGVSDHGRPWYGSFHTEHLSDLDVDEGAELLRRVAESAGDEKLEAYLRKPEARARLKAVAHLAGGSPRMWMVLASCMTIELIDELVPLVEEMLDELVPYYQARLMELPGVERKLVTELCRTAVVDAGGKLVHEPQGMRTVKDLAEACGLDQRVAATALGRLHDAKWVRREKPDGADRRTTWYEIREPLLRHHLQYRETRGEPLRVIVEFLRGLYSVTERRRILADASPTSLAERYVREALRTDLALRQWDAMYAEGSRDELLAAARSVLDVPETDAAMTPTAAIVAEAVAIESMSPTPGAGRDVARLRLATHAERLPEGARSTLDAALRAWTEEPADHPVRAFDAAARCGDAALPAPDRVALWLLVAGWREVTGDAAGAREVLARLRQDEALLDDAGVRRRLAVQAQTARFAAAAGDLRGAARLARHASAAADETFGPDDVDTLAMRRLSIGIPERAGGPEPIDAQQQLVEDLTRVLGRDHPESIAARLRLLEMLCRTGDAERAGPMARQLVDDAEAFLGPTAETTLRVRAALAEALLLEGSTTDATSLFSDLMDALPDEARGSSLESVLRFSFGSSLVDVGDLPAARDQLEHALRLREHGAGQSDLLTATMSVNYALAVTITDQPLAGFRLATDVVQALRSRPHPAPTLEQHAADAARFIAETPTVAQAVVQEGTPERAAADALLAPLGADLLAALVQASAALEDAGLESSVQWLLRRARSDDQLAHVGPALLATLPLVPAPLAGPWATAWRRALPTEPAELRATARILGAIVNSLEDSRQALLALTSEERGVAEQILERLEADP